MPEFPLIGLIWHRNGQQPAERWHTDHTNRERPPAATILHGVEAPSAGGGTSVVNMRAAYAALPEGERKRLRAPQRGPRSRSASASKLSKDAGSSSVRPITPGL